MFSRREQEDMDTTTVLQIPARQRRLGATVCKENLKLKKFVLFFRKSENMVLNKIRYYFN